MKLNMYLILMRILERSVKATLKAKMFTQRLDKRMPVAI